jgi:hypothetical protein
VFSLPDIHFSANSTVQLHSLPDIHHSAINTVGLPDFHYSADSTVPYTTLKVFWPMLSHFHSVDGAR